MRVRKVFITIIVFFLMFGAITWADSPSSDITFEGIGPEGNINAHQVSGQLLQTPNYDWWYGCSPTSAGMMMGYYDRNGYSNLVKGGIAELDTYPSTFGSWNHLAQYAIASVNHVNDFYVNGYMGSGDDTPTGRSFDCLADFMGTSQDNLSTTFGGNTNGGTTFFNYNNNQPLYSSDLESLGFDYYNMSGMYGIKEFVEDSGYAIELIYNQYISGYNGNPDGFTLAEYQAEINAGHPVMIGVEGHSMLGYGYVNGTDIINVFDTWDPHGQNPGTMTWGGAYPHGDDSLQHYAVTVVHFVPEPTSIVIFGLASLIFVRKRR